MLRQLKNFIKKTPLGHFLRPPFRWRKRSPSDSKLAWMKDQSQSGKWEVPRNLLDDHLKAYNDLLEEQQGRLVHTKYAHEDVEMDSAQVISGVSSPIEGVSFLLATVLRLQPEKLVEVGSAFGYASMYLAGGQKGVEGAVFLGIEVDPWRQEIAQSFLNRMGYGWATLFCGTLEEAIEKNAMLRDISFAFVDAEHTKEATTGYWKTLKPFLSPGAVLVFDDIFWSPGMTEFWNWLVEEPDVSEACEVQHRYGVVRFK